MRTAILVVLMVGLSACGGVGDDLPVEDGGAEPTSDAAPEPWCGLSFDSATEAFAGERVCQTTVYDRATGYCTHWQPCSSL